MSRMPKKNADLAIERDGGLCVRCGHLGSNVHHRMMRSQAPKDAVHRVENLAVLCGTGTTGCHGWVHANPAQSYKNGWLVPSWSSPLEEPMTYADGARYYLTGRGTRIKEITNG